MKDAVVDLRVLGPIDLMAPGGPDPEPLLRQPKRLALLVYLLLAGDPWVTREDLVGLLWPEGERDRGRTALRQALKYLREHLPDGVVLARGRRSLGVDSDVVRCDAVDFETRLDEDRLVDALDLYRGELLAGVSFEDEPVFATWLASERERLRARAAGAAWDLAALSEAGGRPAEAAFWAKRGLSYAGLSPTTAEHAMALLLRVGDARGALRVHRGLKGQGTTDAATAEGRTALAEMADRAERMADEPDGSATTRPQRVGGDRRSGSDRRRSSGGWDGAERRRGRDRRAGTDRRARIEGRTPG